MSALLAGIMVELDPVAKAGAASVVAVKKLADAAGRAIAAFKADASCFRC